MTRGSRRPQRMWRATFQLWYRKSKKNVVPRTSASCFSTWATFWTLSQTVVAVIEWLLLGLRFHFGRVTLQKHTAGLWRLCCSVFLFLCSETRLESWRSNRKWDSELRALLSYSRCRANRKKFKQVLNVLFSQIKLTCQKVAKKSAVSFCVTKTAKMMICSRLWPNRIIKTVFVYLLCIYLLFSLSIFPFLWALTFWRSFKYFE